MFLNQFLEAQRRFQAELMSRAGVVGVGIGVRGDDDEDGDEIALVAMVEQKRPKEAIPEADLVPPEIDGVRTKVLEVGFLQAQVNSGSRDIWRPTIPPGVSIAHHLVTAGTYGVMVYDNVTGEPYILSNNHVLANSNDANLGDAILQPGATDGGNKDTDIVATLARYGKLLYVGDAAQASNPIIGAPNQPTPPTPPTTPTNPAPRPPSSPTDNDGCAAFITSFANALAKTSNPDAQVVVKSQAETFDPIAPTTITAQAAVATNQLDAALGKPTGAATFSDDILNIGRITGTAPVAIGMNVRKMGRTTGLTRGTVTVINATIDVGYTTISGRRTARFTGQVMSTGMSQGGDSGSLVVDANSQNAVGLLFAGSGAATVFTPITLVLEKLGVRIVQTEPVG